MSGVSEYLKEGGVLITVTDRLARDLRLRYGLEQRSLGVDMWEQPQIYSFRQWVTHAWESCWPSTQLLHAVQEGVLYRNVIEDSEAAAGLINIPSTARSARRAGALLLTHRIDRSHPDLQNSAEAGVFLGWVSQIEERIQQNKLTTSHLMLDELIAFIANGKYTPPRHLQFVGFIQNTPQEKDFFATLASKGVEVVHLPRLNGEPSGHRYIRPETMKDELVHSVQWLKERLSPYKADPSSAPRIAILVPDMKRYRMAIDTVLREHLTPHHALPANDEHIVPWRFSTGSPLHEHEIVHAAMTVLTIRLHRNDGHLLTRFLLNRRFGNGPEYYARAEIDRVIRARHGRLISLAAIHRLASNPGATGAPRFTERLSSLKDSLEHNNTPDLPSAWVERFQRRLHSMGWPGGHLSSAAFQAVKAWEDCLGLLSSMDSQVGKVRLEVAYSYLQEILSLRDHQPRVPYLQPIQILEYEEAQGMRFNEAMVLGLEAGVLPPTAKPFPFIPVTVQRLFDVPLADADAAYRHGQQLADHLLEVADKVVFSCPMCTEGGERIFPSPLFPGWASALNTASTKDSVRCNILKAGTAVELTAQDPIPAVLSPDNEGIRGGTGIFSQFTEMPFIAFARARLGIQPLPDYTSGIDSMVQGNFVHEVLSRIWRVIKTSIALHGMSNTHIEMIVNSQVEEVSQSTDLLPEWRYGIPLVRLEKARTRLLVQEWLAFEKTRTDTFEVIQTEVRITGMVAGLPLVFRIDRIDRVTDEAGHTRYLLIDYKTGATVDPAGWAPDVLTEPQLPLYATIPDLTPLGVTQVDGIAFAHVKRDHYALPVWSNWTGGLAPSKRQGKPANDWQYLCTLWHRNLSDIASRFLAGEADADALLLARSFLYNDLSIFTRHNQSPAPPAPTTGAALPPPF